MAEVVARDGLLAYKLPNQTREKLWQLDRLISIFCTAMKSKWRLVYADLLSGPGVCIDTLTGEERLGSALIAAQHQEFSRLFINDTNIRATDALRVRLGDQHGGRILIHTGDCNTVAETAREFLFPPMSRRRTLGLAVIDPSAYQMHFDSIRRLTSGVRMDLMIVLMTSYMQRFLHTPSFIEPLSHILGDDQVADLNGRRSRGERLGFDDFLSCFERQLASIGYDYVHRVPAHNSVGGVVYHIIYASRHPLGQEFSARASSRRMDGQRLLPLPS